MLLLLGLKPRLVCALALLAVCAAGVQAQEEPQNPSAIEGTQRPQISPNPQSTQHPSSPLNSPELQTPANPPPAEISGPTELVALDLRWQES